MSRLSLKSLLFEDIDALYQNIMNQSHQHSKLSKAEFNWFYESKKEKIDEFFTKEVIKAYRKNYTHRDNFYFNGILTQEKAMFRAYRKPFRSYFSYLSTGHFLLNNAVGQIIERDHTSTDAICLGLYAQLLRLADQIGILLLNGHDDGALVIWRSHYEYALVLKLLAEADDDDLSSRFMEHNNLNSKKLMESYNKRLVTEGFDQIDDDTRNELLAEEFRLESKYGKDFLGEYGWANKKLDNKRTTFRDIESFLNMSRYRPFYIWASGHAHGTFESFKKVFEDGKIIVNRITEVSTDLESLIDPMQITLAVMQDAVESLLKLIAHPNELPLNLDLLGELYDQFIQHLGETAPSK